MGEEKKRLPVGLENFEQIINDNYYYVDKTGLISELIRNGGMVNLFTRPRRFGKTLNMSMLEHFFSIERDQSIYDGLEISKDTKLCEEYMGKYPVISISLKGINAATYEDAFDFAVRIMKKVARNVQFLLGSDALSDYDKLEYKELLNNNMSEAAFCGGLKILSELLEKHYGTKVVLLIDEYDVPLQSAYLNGYYDDMVFFLKNMLSAALKTNDALEKGILTGCLRIARESIFTGLNNFKVITIFDDTSNQQFGFTQKEMDLLLSDYQAEAYRDKVKEWYDGYQFGSCDIYNPWSVLMYIEKLNKTHMHEPESFWANTSGNDIIYRYIKEANPKMREEFDILVSGGVIEKPIKDTITYREMDQINNVYSFLLFTGYLKAMKCVDNEKRIYQLSIPNKEIKQIYVSIFSEWFNEQVEHNGTSFVEALRKEQIRNATEILNNVLFQSISYFDYDEKFYHGLLLGMLNDYIVASNKEYGLGRADIAILPRSIMDRGLILELKIATSMAEVRSMAQKACEQIRQQKYMEGLLANGYEDVIGYGIAFYKKSCVITKV